MDLSPEETGCSWSEAEQALWNLVQAKVLQSFALLRSARDAYKRDSRQQCDEIMRLAWQRCEEAEEGSKQLRAPARLRRVLIDQLADLKHDLFAVKDFTR